MKHIPFLAFALAATLATGCASTDDRQFAGEDTANTRDVVMSPVQDVGLSKIKIPAYLANMQNPYLDPPRECGAIRSEVEQLDALLGADFDVPEDAKVQRDRNRLNGASDTIGAVLIPFRGLVRVVSGAAKNERNARNAYDRGLVRRAYLKGLYVEESCYAQGGPL